jgi:iron-sulfur cluster insertion protein
VQGNCAAAKIDLLEESHHSGQIGMLLNQVEFMDQAIEIGTTGTSAMPGIVFTDAAARKVQQLILEERNPDLKLRVYISGGGCSGFQYGFSFDEEQAEDDIAVSNDGMILLVDPLSFQYLMGAEVDYSESLQGAQFVIRNPNASTTCGCGSSFAV